MYSNMEIKHYMNQQFYPLFCGYQQCSPSYSFGPAVRECYLLHFCLDGKGSFYADNAAYHIEKGQGFLICPGKLTFYQADEGEPWTYIWIAFGGELVSKYLQICGLSQENPIVRSEYGSELKALAEDMIRHHTSSLSDTLYNQGLLFQFFSYLSMSSGLKADREENTDNCYIAKAIEYIKINYQSPMTVHDIADYVSLNRCYLTTIFQKNVHFSPQQFLMKYRITKAAELLLSSDLPVQTIAFSCGYANSLSFAKAFKKITGMNPSTYRKTKKLPPDTVRTEDPHQEESF